MLDSNPSINELRRLIPTVGMDTTLGHQNTNNPFNNTLAPHHQRHNQHSTLGDHNLSTGKKYVCSLKAPLDYYYLQKISFQCQPPAALKMV